MARALVLQLPDGRRVSVSPEQAHELADRLWGFGTVAGAPMAAARIVEALRAGGLRGESVAFEEREVAPLLEAAEHNSLRWAPRR